MAAHQAPPSLGFSRQKYWNGLPFPSPMHENEIESEVAQSCPTLSDSMDCGLPGSSIHEIFQTRVLEWVVIAFWTTVHILRTQWLQPKEWLEEVLFCLCYKILTSNYYMIRKQIIAHICLHVPGKPCFVIPFREAQQQSFLDGHWKSVFTGGSMDDVASWGMMWLTLNRWHEGTVKARKSILLQIQIWRNYGIVRNNSIATFFVMVGDMELVRRQCIRQ